ncbi:MAG: MATE family efflux transporter [Lachnospiraceae bacterium]|nr:MATE family efflux transporter [Lachnospiraceae bacterium]
MSEIKQNKMGTMPCNKLLLTMSVPMMLSMLVQALYNIVDSIFVSRVSENALTAVSLAFPVQTLMIAIIGGTGVGINARLSRKLGERRFDEVNLTAGNAILLNAIYAAVILIVGQFAASLYYNMMTPDAEIRAYGTDYLYVIMTFSAALIFQVTFERLLQSTGLTIWSMISQTTGAILNIILDPIMIFGLFGCPAMGTRGAALATVVGQTVAACIGLAANLKVNKEIRFEPRFMMPDKQTIAQIYAVGLPSIIMQSIGSVMNFCLNKILLDFSSTAAAVFGVYFKLQSFVFMPVFGLNNGVVPIIAYNYGARRPDRIKETFRYAAIYAMSIMAVGFLLFELIPGQMLALFNASDHMIEIGVPALRFLATPFIVAGYCIMCSSVFQALGHGVLSLWVSLTRQIIVLLPCAFILSRVIGLTGVWAAFPIAEIASAALSILFIRRIMRQEVDTLYND